MKVFTCDNCGKDFSVPDGPAALLAKCPEKVCSPKCGAELVLKPRKR